MKVVLFTNYAPSSGFTEDKGTEYFYLCDMATKNVDEILAFTYIWAIENCPIFLAPESIESPVFKVDTIENTEWFLALNDIDANVLSYSIHREKDSGPDSVEIAFELALLSNNGLYIKSENHREKFDKGGHFEFQELVDDIFGSNKSRYIMNDTLTLRCQMWRMGLDTPRPNLCFAGTRLGLERRTFFWRVRNFSTLTLGQDEKYQVVPMIAGIPTLTVVMCLMESYGKESVIVKFLENSKTNFLRFNCDISVLDANGMKIISKRCVNLSTSSETFMYLFEKNEVEDINASLIPNDMLCVRCEFEIGCGAIWSEIEYYLHPISQTNRHA